MTKRAIIGAGLSGLLAARRAISNGDEVTLISPNVGGQIAGVEMAGLNLDVGAESLSIATGEGRELLQELGLEDQIVSPLQVPAKIISKERQIDIPKGFFGIPADLGDPGLREAFSEAELSVAKELDARPFGSYASVADLIENRLGRAFLERVISPVIYGVHSSSPEKLSALATFPRLMELATAANSLTAGVAAMKQGQARAGANVVSLRGGMHTLVSTLFEVLSQELGFVASKVSAISERDDSWVVQHDRGVDSFDALTLACPAKQIANFADSLPEVANAAANITQVDSWVALVHVKSHGLNGFPLGTGALVAEDSGLSAKATTHVSAKWSWVASELAQDHHIIRLSFGRNGEFQNLASLGARLRAEIEMLYGTEVEVLDYRVVHWDSALAQPNQGANSELLSAVSKFPSLELASGFVIGNGILGIVKEHNLRRAAWA
jgi:protoporphyrinogen/coproporphyrinogen III oxidase